MDATAYYNLKGLFFNLTGKKADDDLTAFFAYVNMLNMKDIKDRLSDIKVLLTNIEVNTKKN